MKHFQKTSKRLLLISKNKSLKKYRQSLKHLTSLLIICFMLSITGCIDLVVPGTGSGSTYTCRDRTSNNIHYYPLNGQHAPFRNWLDGNIRSCTYKLFTNNICVSENADANISVYVDSSAVIEGLTVTGVATSTSPFLFYRKDLNITYINNFNTTGQSKFIGDAILNFQNNNANSIGCNVYATIEFPTKGSEQQDLNYLYSKVFDVYINLDYYMYE